MSLSGLPEKATKKKEVFVIDLLKDSVEVLAGKDPDFGQGLKAAVDNLALGSGPYRLHDWGGVISNAEEGNRTKLRQVEGADIVFSFTPWNEKGKSKIQGMVDFARSAGFVAMMIMTQKEGQGGKVHTFSNFRNATNAIPITYYEDTYEVIKECAVANTTLYHVLSPGFPVDDSKKVPEVIDGTADGYLELWETSSAGNGAPATPTATGRKAKSQSPTAVASMHPAKLNEFLAHNSYLGSNVCATLVDYQQYMALSELPVDEHTYPHLKRWREHIGYLMKTFGHFDFLGRPLSAGTLLQM